MIEKLRICYNENNMIFTQEINSIEEGKQFIKNKTKEDLKNDENIFGIEQFLNNIWSEWRNDIGQDIMDIIQEEDRLC